MKKINKKKIVIILSIVLIIIILLVTITLIKKSVETENIGKIQRREMNQDNYTMVRSKDGIDVPVPKGYVASSIESESYVNGINETLYLSQDITNTFTSEGEYPWNKNEEGIWVSGNQKIDSSISEMVSENFTINEDGEILKINWMVSSEFYNDYLYGEIINTSDDTITETTIKLNGTDYGPSSYMDTKIALNKGTYKLKIIYTKNDSMYDGLDKGFVKKVEIYSRNDKGKAETIQNHKYGGFVIYEGTEQVTEENQWTAQCERNQWVWVPIKDVNDMYVYDKSEKRFYGTHYVSTPTSYERDTTATGNKRPQLTENDKQSVAMMDYLRGISRFQFLKNLEQEFYEMLQNVADYGGFYISRYEMSGVETKRMADALSSNWYYVYKESSKARGTNTNVTTSMLWGSQYDQILKWLIETGAKTPLDVNVGSVAWGNYKDVEFTYYTNVSKETAIKNIGEAKAIPTGAYEGAKANNIYDLAGNVWKWTFETNGNGDYRYRNVRGGSYSYDGTNGYVADRGGAYPIYGSYGYYATLYIN